MTSVQGNDAALATPSQLIEVACDLLNVVRNNLCWKNYWVKGLDGKVGV
jgi:hypothetical protein